MEPIIYIAFILKTAFSQSILLLSSDVQSIRKQCVSFCHYFLESAPDAWGRPGGIPNFKNDLMSNLPLAERVGK